MASVQSLVAQTNDLFQFSFHGRCQSLNDQGRLATTRIEEQDLIARCVGTNAVDPTGTNSSFALVYNAGSNSVQVVNATNGAFVCDVFEFQGGISNTDGRRLERMTFVFAPDQAEAIGSAIINEKIKHKADRASISGQLQFALATPVSGTGDTNLVEQQTA